LHHVAGNARVLANDYRRTAPDLVVAHQYPTGCVPQPECEFGIDCRPTDAATNTVGTKILTFAHTKDSSFIVRHIFTASTVSATSCTRRMCPPFSSPYKAAARLDR